MFQNHFSLKMLMVKVMFWLPMLQHPLQKDMQFVTFYISFLRDFVLKSRQKTGMNGEYAICVRQIATRRNGEY